MPVENATSFAGLNPDYPAVTEPKSQGDDHLRMMKAIEKRQLGALGSGALTVSAEQINAVAASGGQYATGNSTTSLLIGTGSKTFTTETGRAFAVGQRLKLTSKANVANYMSGIATAVNTTTGSNTILVDQTGGSGTYADWSVAVFLPDPNVTLKQRNITGADTVIASDSSKVLHYTASANSTLALTAAAILADGFVCTLRNATNTDWTIDPSGAELICGQSTIVVKPGFTGILKCDGAAFDILWIKQRSYSLDRLVQVTSNTSRTVGPDTYVERAYAVGAGSAAAASTRNGASGGMAWGDYPVKPGDTVTTTFSAGVATIAVNGVTMLTGNPASGTTAGTASKHASVTNGGTNNGAAATSFSSAVTGASSGSPLGPGVVASTNQSGGTGWGGAGAGGNGGGTAGAAAAGVGGRAVSASSPSGEPLLALLAGVPGVQSSSSGGDGGPGAGGAVGTTTNRGGHGGIGAGGGGTGNGGIAGNGGFGASGGVCGSSGTSGSPGCGAGGGLDGAGGVVAPGVAGVLYFKELA